MAIRRPSRDELDSLAEDENFSLTDEEAAVFHQRLDFLLESYDRLDQLPEPKPPVSYPRLSGYRPEAEENRSGGWAWRCSLYGAREGPLSGKRIAVKDTVSVAGMPLINGSRMFEGYIPDIDATIVTRILDAGGEIVGKTVCEDFCFSGGSHTSYPAPVANPHRPDHMAGGSSSGSAVVIVNGECDMTIGGDQGGSIRIPSAWCGIYGLKPTWGLVPYTGIFPGEMTLDHTGPMAATVSDLALLLEVIAGKDHLDPRQSETPVELPQYSRLLDGDIRGLRVGVVSEGFAWPGISEVGSDDVVREAAQRFERLGATVRDLSIPWHRDAIHLYTAITVEGAWSMMIQGETTGHGWKGFYDTHLMDYYGPVRRSRTRDFPATVKVVALLGRHLADAYHSRYYAKAQNLRRALVQAYDDALKEVDLLVMPTAPQKAVRLDAVTNLAAYLDLAECMTHNVAAADVTGHPALSAPCGWVGGLPIGMMLIGRHFDESTVLRAAYAFEQHQ